MSDTIVVSDKHERHSSFLLYLYEQVEDHTGIVGIQIACWFIGEQYRRVVSQAPGNCHSLSFSTR
jgi:hypothetical protein